MWSNIFNPENHFFRGLGRLVDVVAFSLLWLAGAATVGLYMLHNWLLAGASAGDTIGLKLAMAHQPTTLLLGMMSLLFTATVVMMW